MPIAPTTTFARPGPPNATQTPPPASPDLSTLNGVEGAAARAYFDCLMEFNRSDMTWPGRQKHPSNDPLNALLSFTYTLLMHELTALAQGVGLEPYLGFLHQLDYGRPSLALDLVEPLRHPFADRLVLTVVNRAVIQPDDFQRGGERPGLFLSPKALKRYVAEYERWMLASPLPAPADSSSPSTPRPRRRDLLKAEVERLAAALRDGHPFQPYSAADPQPPCNTSSVTI